MAVSFEETWSADSEQTANTRMTCGAPSGRPKAPSCRSLFPDAEAGEASVAATLRAAYKDVLARDVKR